MKKNMKKFIKVTAFLAVISMIQPVFGAVLIFNRSLPNQAGASYDSVLDTWDYLTMPGLYSNLTSNAISFGFTNDGKLTDQNTFFGGGRLTLGAPIYLVAGLRNGDSTFTNNEGSTSTAQPAGTVTTNAVDTSKTLNNSIKIAAGTSFGNAGIQVFADFNTSGSDKKFTAASTAVTTALKTGEIEQRSGGTYDRYGINYGMKSGEMVVNFGAAIRSSRGSSATFSSVDGTLSSTLTNSKLATANAFPAIATAGAIGGAGAATVAGNLEDAANGTINKRSGLVFSSFGWMPMPLLTDKDVVGWAVDYSASTMFGADNYILKHTDSTNNDNWTAELENKTSGLGDLTINPYLIIPRSLGDAGNLYINLDLKALISTSVLDTTPKVSGKINNTDFTATQIADGFATVAAGICGVSRTFCDNVKTEISLMQFTLGLPIIAEININKSLVWILGTFPKIMYTSYKKTTTTTDLNDPKATSTDVTVAHNDGTNGYDDGKISTSVDFTTGLKFKAAENFDINMLMTNTTNELKIDTFSVSANYIFK